MAIKKKPPMKGNPFGGKAAGKKSMPPKKGEKCPTCGKAY